MKAKAPEKLYIALDELTEDGRTFVLDHRVNYPTCTEYTRTDAFIEKALKWYCLDCECNDNCNADYKCFFRQEYKRYLEGNNNAIPPKFDNAINPDGSLMENYRYRHFIRKVRDAFIEKACAFLQDRIEHDSIDYPMATHWLIEDFRKYMEGE